MNEFFYNFFITDNKSGNKTKEPHLLNKYPEIHKKIIDFCDNEFLSRLPFKQKVWHTIYSVKNVVNCEECGEPLIFKRTLKEGYGKYCSLTCTNKNQEHIKKIKITNNMKYGGNAPISSNEIKKKIKDTNIEKYGVDNTWKRLDMVEKGFMKNHGVNHVSEVDGVKLKKIKTCLNKYGKPSILTTDKVLSYGHTTRRDSFLNKYNNYNMVNHIGDDLIIVCDKCNSEYTINRTLFRYRDSVKVNPCTICNPINDHVSIQEKELQGFISGLGVSVSFNNRELIKPKELDIVIDDHKVVIEFNGLYWHSSGYIDNNYHINKTKSCNDYGYQLIHIFEDEWVNKKEIVKSIIKNKLNIYGDRVFGRKCSVVELTPKQYKDFCITNHIQGSVNASIKLGLIHGDELVSVMSFGGLRKSLGSTSVDGSYEMLRFCNKLNTNVVGGASKLFNYFVKNYKPQNIISFSDNRYFDGGLYTKLGFIFDKNTKPNYFYITNGLTRENRFKYRKDVLVSDGYDKNKTEKQIMEDRGIPRIYDCGNKKWVWSLTNQL